MSKKQMIINYVPGEECRVAIVEDGRLEEFHAERMDGPSNHVGNIYVGKVQNVEQSIQAAFIDFGLEQNGFLHTSDVHPQYFPGEESDKTERVGRKTPRRERPPIQDCFRRGDEVAVQVLKEGVGTKGPTVTSYLSIPGRFLVMMPQMDKVGVSRKVEDEETRRKMREILDQLDLPEGFGFILRTAGMERSKAELKRDLAYLMRLWKDMERRWKTGNKPRLLYSESDLLVRALRDLLTTDIDEVVVDNEAALARAARFLKIVSPRTTTNVVHYTGKAPIFHVMGIEPQIQIIHAREVPLPSGGRLVIDETEALVAIDVNSGRSREARDSETNAYETNLEAVDEICRQLRLRDLGGVIVSDLIDMRSAKHRRDIEGRFRDILKKDRARWTTAPISEFGILEMTRQRMRASHESQHFADCPTCRGRGLVQRPDSVAADALRDLAALLDNDAVRRVELVVHPRLAGELLSTRRRALSRIERGSGNPPKHVDVRVSEAIPVDRVTFYAYDERAADLDLAKLGHRKAKPDELVSYAIASDAAEEWAAEPEVLAPEPEMYPDEQIADAEAHPIELEPLTLAEISAQDRAGRAPQPQRGPVQGGGDEFQGDGTGPRRRRRRRRGGRGRGPDGAPIHGDPGFNDAPQYPQQFDENGDPIAMPPAHAINIEDQEPIVADPDHAVGQGTHHHDHGGAPGVNNMPGGELGDGGPRRRRRRGRRGRGRGPEGAPGMPPQMGPDAEFAPPADMPEGQFNDQHFQGDEQAPLPPEAGFAPEHGDAEVPYIENADNVGGFQNGPDGQPMLNPDGTPRRRRRRGGRGRNRNRDGAGPIGPGGPGGPNEFGAPMAGAPPVRAPQPPPPPGPRPSGRGTPPAANSLADMFRTAPDGLERGFTDDAPMDAPAGGFGPAPESLEGDGAPEFNDNNSGPADIGPDGQPMLNPDGTPRRRRRRGGRGRNRNRDGAGPGGPGGPREESGGGGRGPQGNNAPRSSPPPQSRPPQSSRPGPGFVPPPAPPAASSPANAPKIRTLYGSRKRLPPGVVKTIKRED
jgi:ribonuclease E